MRMIGWCRENGLAYRLLVNEISAEEMRTPRNKSKLMPGPRDLLEKEEEFVQLVNNVPNPLLAMPGRCTRRLGNQLTA
jgi:hypothetical protein